MIGCNAMVLNRDTVMKMVEHYLNAELRVGSPPYEVTSFDLVEGTNGRDFNVRFYRVTNDGGNK